MTKIRKIDLEKPGLSSFLSPLEEEILTVLFEMKVGTTKEIHAEVSKKKEVSLTSIAVTLDRLCKAKLLSRRACPDSTYPCYLYTLSQSKEEIEHSFLDRTVNKLIENLGPVAVNYFNERFRPGQED